MSVNMSLEDIIRKEKEERRNSDRPAKSGAMEVDSNRRGPVRSEGGRKKRSAAREPYQRRPSQRSGSEGESSSSSSSSAGSLEKKWSHDLFDAPIDPEAKPEGRHRRGGRADREIELGTAVFVSGINFEVDEEELNELFGKYGEIYSAKIHYDRSGRSKGTGKVSFKRKADAEDAIKSLSGRPLKGETLTLEIKEDRHDDSERRSDGDDRRGGDRRGDRRSGNDRRGGGGGGGGDRRGDKRGRNDSGSMSDDRNLVVRIN